MNNHFDELTKGLARSATRRGALKQFGTGLAGTAGLAIRPHGDQLELTWPGGVLQSATEAEGPYGDVTHAVSPLRITPSTGRSFYRVKIR